MPKISLFNPLGIKKISQFELRIELQIFNFNCKLSLFFTKFTYIYQNKCILTCIICEIVGYDARGVVEMC